MTTRLPDHTDTGRRHACERARPDRHRHQARQRTEANDHEEHEPTNQGISGGLDEEQGNAAAEVKPGALLALQLIALAP